ncbi:hypothetical protein PGB90_007370 [Kerria lacca]
MIFFASILFLVHVYAAPQEQGADIFDAEDTCLAKYPSLTREFMENLKLTRVLPENPTDDFKCFLFCVGKTLSAINHSGEYHFDTLKELTVAVTGGDATHDDAHAMVSKCIVADHENNCEKAWKYVQCKVEELQPYKFSKGFCPSCSKKK